MYIVIYVCRQKVYLTKHPVVEPTLVSYCHHIPKMVYMHAQSLWSRLVAIVCAVPHYSGKYIWLTIKLSDTEREGTPECLLYRVALYSMK